MPPDIFDLIEDTSDVSEVSNLITYISLLKSKFTSEFKQNTVDIFIEYVNSDNGVLNKESLIFLNQIWKNQI